MVVALGPGRFYGSSLPRPRFYADVKLNDERVDPPLSVLDPLLEWATDAHWSMGGLNFKRHRLQGKIEGSIKKLRAEKERKERKKSMKIKKGEIDDNGFLTPSPTLRRNLALLNEDSLPTEAEERKRPHVAYSAGSLGRKKRSRRLGEEFDRIASRSGEVIRRSDEASESIGRSSKKKIRILGRTIDLPVSVESSPTVAAVASRTRSRRPTVEETPIAAAGDSCIGDAKKVTAGRELPARSPNKGKRISPRKATTQNSG